MMNRKQTYFAAFAVIFISLTVVVLSSSLSWFSIQKSFGELNTTDVPVLDRASEVSLKISQSRTELYRYVNNYEPSPFRIHKHLKKVHEDLQWINQQKLPQDIKDITRALLLKSEQFQNTLNLLEFQKVQKESIQILLTTNQLTGFATTLSSLSDELRENLWDYILFKNEESQNRILRDNALLSIISFILVLILFFGVLFQNRILKRQVEERTIELEDRLRDLHQSKQSLQESETKFRELADLLPQAVFETDAVGRLTYANQFLFQIFGYADSDFKNGLSILDLLLPAQRNDAKKRIERFLADENLPEAEYIALRKNGTPFPVLIYSSKIRSHLKKTGLRGIIVDITEHKQAEADRERLLSVIEQIVEAIIITDAHGNIQYVNSAFERITGYSRKEVTGKNSRILKSGKYDDAFYRHIWQNLNSGKTWRGKLVNRKKDDTFYTVEASISPVIDKVGGIINFVAVQRDITHEIKLEEELRQAQKMESIGTLAGGIAHDFNNIIYLIIGNAELALDDVPEINPAHECLQEITAACLRGADIVRQLLNFSHKKDIALKPMDISAVVKDALKFLRPMIPANVEMRTDFAIENVTILADLTQINQVMMNLCINASQEMEETGGILDINVGYAISEGELADDRQSSGAKKYVKIVVSDTGPGIHPDIISRIFDPYFTTKEFGKGSGMGLSVVHGIVKNHNGFMTVDSKPGKGATFTIFFPVVDQASADEAQIVQKLLPGNESILFVDDEKSIIDMAQKMLNRLGYQVEAKTNPMEALALFQSRPDDFDLVITDMTMPQLTGIQLFEKLQEIRSGIPVIICTGHSPLLDEENAKKMGVSAYVMKPMRKNAIAKTIREVLDTTK